MGGGGHIADFNNRIKHLGSLLKRKRLSENRLLTMPNGRNSVIQSKDYLSNEEKEKLRVKYIEYYQKERLKRVKIAIISVTLTLFIVGILVILIMKLVN